MNKIYKYDLVESILEYGVHMNPMTQMLMLGFDVQSYEYRRSMMCYWFVASGEPFEMPPYICEVSKLEAIRSKAA